MLTEGAEKLGISLTDDHQRQCLRYLDLLMEWNGKMNLTAIRDPSEAIVKHFLDSMTLIPLLPNTPRLRMADVGTGAGFPGLVLKILRHDLRLLLLDSLNKRLHFLQVVVENLGLEDVETLHARAEDAGRDSSIRGQFDVVTARAVAELSVLAEYCLPLARVGGLFLAMKGPRGEEELNSARESIRKLGGEVENIHPISLPYFDEPRIILSTKKVKPTPARYPRKPAEIKKSPL